MQKGDTSSPRLTWLQKRKGAPRLVYALLCLIALWSIGTIDSMIDYRISLLVLYILPVGFATIYVGPVFAVFLAGLSVVLWKCGDYLAGMPHPGFVILFWNGTIVFTLFVIVIALLDLLRRTLVGLEKTVEERTSQLTHEMGERGRMEREIIELSEKEQQRFGQELHDVVCQELASVAIASHLLTRKLLAQELPEASHAREIAGMADHALAQARSVARGFFTAGFDTAGLEEAMREAARHAAERGKLSCSVRWQENLVISHEDAVINLFRIAQEALQNAIKHAGASQITITMESIDEVLRLIIEDNGKGLDNSSRSTKGLGLSIMAYRAGLIGGEFKIERLAKGGTRVACLVPVEKLASPPIPVKV